MRLLHFLVPVSILVLLPSCVTEDSVQVEIDAANYCDVDADCVSAGTKCPFGCFIPVNKNEVERIKQVLDDYDGEECQYKCAILTGLSCQNKVCVSQTGP